MVFARNPRSRRERQGKEGREKYRRLARTGSMAVIKTFERAKLIVLMAGSSFTISDTELKLSSPKGFLEKSRASRDRILATAPHVVARPVSLKSTPETPKLAGCKKKWNLSFGRGEVPP
jgi:hypothetical protein